MATLQELFPTSELINYANGRQKKVFPLAGLFPDYKTQSNKIRVINQDSVIPEIAHIHAYDTEAEIGNRSGSVSELSTFYLKRKFVIGEQDMMVLNQPRTEAEKQDMMQNIFADSTALEDALGAAIELMRVKLMTEKTFSLTSAATGADNDVKFDYSLPASSQLSKVDFSSTDVDPIKVLEDWVNDADFEVTRGMLSKKAMAAILTNPNTVKRVHGINSAFTLQSVLPADFEAFMSNNQLPELFAYTGGKYKDNGKIKTYIADGRMALFGDGIVGNTAYGLTPEESRMVYSGDIQSSQVGNFMFTAYEEGHDPIEDIIKASTNVIPTLAQKNTLLQADVLG